MVTFSGNSDTARPDRRFHEPFHIRQVDHIPSTTMMMIMIARNSRALKGEKEGEEVERKYGRI